MRLTRDNPPSVAIRLTICGALTAAAVTGFYFLGLRFVSQYYYRQGSVYWHQNEYLRAAERLHKALELQPADDRILKNIGQVYHLVSESEQDSGRSRMAALKAKSHLLKAAQQNPFDVDIAYNLSVVEQHLAQIKESYGLSSAANARRAKLHLEKAVKLSPNVAFYRMMYADYLHSQGSDDELFNAVYAIVALFPQAYFELVKKPYWSPQLRAAAQSGAKQAVAANKASASAHKVLSALLAEAGQWKDAILPYQRMLQLMGPNAQSKHYIHLGLLCLRSKNAAAAADHFYRAFLLAGREFRVLEKLFDLFKREGALADYVAFHARLRDELTLTPKADLILARAYLILNQPERATAVLEDFIRRKPDSQAYYQLYEAAKLKQDWDKMELAIQKACVLDPANVGYRRNLFDLLRKRKKFSRLEREITKVIDRLEKGSVYLFEQRARLRMNRRDYLGAIKDWKAAIEINPNIDYFYFFMAEAYLNLGDVNAAVTNYKKAARINPKNQDYKKKIHQLEAS
jgi:tetratricopeptide (TPR) repeat protein